eukprot:105795-Ditylum_brightwellii.AAC.1
MYKPFFGNYYDTDLDWDLRDRRFTSSIIIATNKVATHYEISKQPEPTGATASAELDINRVFVCELGGLFVGNFEGDNIGDVEGKSIGAFKGVSVGDVMDNFK